MTGREPITIAFYLPGFHRSPENDEWWGEGFTEWSAVLTARPRFDDHHQPHVPADLGLYDLGSIDAITAQAELAQRYQIDAFCIYHYWHLGRRLLSKPLDRIMSTGEPDFPFCLSWANHNWSRTWTAGTSDMLSEQRYSSADDRRHIQFLLPILDDPRYLRVDDRPVLLIHAASALPDAAATVARWREEYWRHNRQDLYLCRVEHGFIDGGDPRPLGFDAAVEFQPDLFRSVPNHLTTRLSPTSTPLAHGLRYVDLVDSALARTVPEYPWHRCVCPGWDNSARREAGSFVITDADPWEYSRWLDHATEHARGNEPGLVFVNAWNEWGEGCHLEPCQRWGREFLEAHLATGDE